MDSLGHKFQHILNNIMEFQEILTYKAQYVSTVYSDVDQDKERILSSAHVTIVLITPEPNIQTMKSTLNKAGLDSPNTVRYAHQTIVEEGRQLNQMELVKIAHFSPDLMKLKESASMINVVKINIQQLMEDV